MGKKNPKGFKKWRKGSAVHCRAQGRKSEEKNWTINQKRTTMERGRGVGDGDGHSYTLTSLEVVVVG